MTDPRHDPETQSARLALAKPLGWTRLGMALERAVRCFWPLWVIAGAVLTFWAFGGVLSPILVGVACGLSGLAPDLGRLAVSLALARRIRGAS